VAVFYASVHTSKQFDTLQNNVCIITVQCLHSDSVYESYTLSIHSLQNTTQYNIYRLIYNYHTIHAGDYVHTIWYVVPNLLKPFWQKRTQSTFQNKYRIRSDNKFKFSSYSVIQLKSYLAIPSYWVCIEPQFWKEDTQSQVRD
jgi:hypothetical protein